MNFSLSCFIASHTRLRIDREQRVKLGRRVKQRRQQEIEQRPQLVQIVLQGCARQNNLVFMVGGERAFVRK